MKLRTTLAALLLAATAAHAGPAPVGTPRPMPRPDYIGNTGNGGAWTITKNGKRANVRAIAGAYDLGPSNRNGTLSGSYEGCKNGPCHHEPAPTFWWAP